MNIQQNQPQHAPLDLRRVTQRRGMRFADRFGIMLHVAGTGRTLPDPGQTAVLRVPGSDCLFLCCPAAAAELFGIKSNSFSESMKGRCGASLFLEKAKRLAENLGLPSAERWNVYTCGEQDVLDAANGGRYEMMFQGLLQQRDAEQRTRRMNQNDAEQSSSASSSAESDDGDTRCDDDEDTQQCSNDRDMDDEGMCGITCVGHAAVDVLEAPMPADSSRTTDTRKRRGPAVKNMAVRLARETLQRDEDPCEITLLFMRELVGDATGDDGRSRICAVRRAVELFESDFESAEEARQQQMQMQMQHTQEMQQQEMQDCAQTQQQTQQTEQQTQCDDDDVDNGANDEELSFSFAPQRVHPSAAEVDACTTAPSSSKPKYPRVRFALKSPLGLKGRKGRGDAPPRAPMTEEERDAEITAKMQKMYEKSRRETAELRLYESGRVGSASAVEREGDDADADEDTQCGEEDTQCDDDDGEMEEDSVVDE